MATRLKGKQTGENVLIDKDLFEHNHNPLQIMGEFVDKGYSVKDSCKIVHAYEEGFYNPVKRMRSQICLN